MRAGALTRHLATGNFPEHPRTLLLIGEIGTSEAQLATSISPDPIRTKRWG